MNRADLLQQLHADAAEFDIVVIGGGASGLGAAVDAAARGYRVALLEQADFAKGTSSRSTKLVHGGVRYLQQGNISLVLEALRERGRLAANAAHLVRSQAFVIPTYKWWQAAFYGLGMKFYDLLAGKLGLEPSRRLSRTQTLQQVPNVAPEGLRGGVLYYDGQFDDSRLAINLAQTAVEQGAIVLNYCRCVGLLKADGRTCGVQLHELEGGQQLEVRAKIVINATGVFVDSVRQMDAPEVDTVVAASQGVHIVLPRRFLPGDAALMVPKTADGRVLFAVPWQGCVVVGTTDTPRSTSSLEPRALQEERDFIMTHIREYLSEAPSDADVLSIYAGLRPLVQAGGGGHTAALSRDHSILLSPSGLITLTGGKWTTYRKMAEDVIDQAELQAGLLHRKSVTEALRIHGWSRERADSGHLSGYGANRFGILDLIAVEPELGALLHPKLPYQKAEVIWHARTEMARTLEDVLARRTRALLLNATASIEAAPVVAELLAAELGRDSAWQATKVEQYTELARGYVFSDPASVGV